MQRTEQMLLAQCTECRPRVCVGGGRGGGRNAANRANFVSSVHDADAEAAAQKKMGRRSFVKLRSWNKFWKAAQLRHNTDCRAGLSQPRLGAVTTPGQKAQRTGIDAAPRRPVQRPESRRRSAPGSATDSSGPPDSPVAC